jgi:signal peptidase I
MKKEVIIDNIKTLLYALFIAFLIRSFFFQPFYIPSSSMEPNLLIGDRLFVSKFSYGYSRHSFPFSPKVFKGRFFDNKPKRGDIIVFKTPSDNRTDYIKRLIGLPGDIVQIINKDLYLNNKKIVKKKVSNSININCGNENLESVFFEETLPNGTKYLAVYRKNGTMINTDKFIVPDNHYFFMGDNRDCSRDSRFLSSVGYVNFNNLVGKAQIIFFSNDYIKGSFFEFWKWNKSIRFYRMFKKII